MGDHGGSPVRVLEVVAGPLHVPVSPHLAALVEEIAWAVLADDGAAGVNLADYVEHCSGGQ